MRTVQRLMPLVLLLVLLLPVSTYSVAVGQEGGIVTFPDSNLESAIREAIGKPMGLYISLTLEGFAA